MSVFTWLPGPSGRGIPIDQIENPLFIHFEHENWKPIFLEPSNYHVTRTRVIPEDKKNKILKHKEKYKV